MSILTDARDALLALGTSAVLFTAGAGLIEAPVAGLTGLGLDLTGGVAMAYAVAGLGLFAANVASVASAVRKALSK